MPLASEPSTDQSPRIEGERTLRTRQLRALEIAAILAVAAALRLPHLNRTSLWYDEVVTMRVARTDGPAALVAQLDRLDGTRAPLHPLLLQAWLRAFGPSDLAARSLSALCGLFTVFVVYLVASRAFDDRAGRWAAWLGAVCPPMVYYAREARMYAWLVLVSCLSWLLFFSFRRAARPAACALYGLLLVALGYSHPLGLFMVAAHGLAYLSVRPALKLSVRWWLAIQLAVLLAIAPWLRRYLDHGTDYPMPRYPVRFLMAVPIEYVGGNRFVLLLCLAIVALGMLSRDKARHRLVIADPVENLVLIIWTITPLVLMYLYSCFIHPIFGPARYHLYVAPAYLILLAHGLSKLPALVRWPAATAGFLLSLSLLYCGTYGQFVKADWRGFAEWLKTQETPGRTETGASRITVVVHPSDPRFPRDQVEAARYYLTPPFHVVLAGDATDSAATTYEAFCLSRPRKPGKPAPGTYEFDGLIVQRKPALDTFRRFARPER